MLIMSIWLMVVPFSHIQTQDMVLTESIVWLYNRKSDKRKNTFSDSRDC